MFYDTLGHPTHDVAHAALHALASASIFTLACAAIALALVYGLPKARPNA